MMDEAIKILACLIIAMLMGGLAGAGVRDIYRSIENAKKS